MLILFSAKNYRSIRTEQELSLVASPYYAGKKASEPDRKNRKRQTITKALPGLSGKTYLRSVAIYGANGSGKSNIAHAMATMQQIVEDSASYLPADHIPYDPFALDAKSKQSPTEYFIAFYWGDRRYEYEFSHDDTRIVYEQLSSFPKGQRRVLYRRSTNSQSHTEVDGSKYLPVSDTIVSMLNPNVLLLSFLYAHPGLRGYEEIENAGKFFQDGLIVLDRVWDRWREFPVSGEVLDGTMGSEYQRALIQKMMRDSDVGIRSARIVRKKSKGQDPRGDSGDSGADNNEVVMKTVVLDHRGAEGEGEINLANESLGTMQVFSLSSFIGEALERDATLVVDELDASMHPILAQEIVEMFERPNLKDRSAQLVFTAHQTYLMSGGTLERDQIWLTDKGPDGGTVLYPLSDYSPRKGEPIAQGYLLGRYAGVPVLPENFGISPATSGDGDSSE